MGEFYKALEALGKDLGADPTAVGILLIPPLALMYFRFKYHQDVLKSPRGLAGVREARRAWRLALRLFRPIAPRPGLGGLPARPIGLGCG